MKPLYSGQHRGRENCPLEGGVCEVKELECFLRIGSKIVRPHGGVRYREVSAIERCPLHRREVSAIEMSATERRPL